MIQETWIYENNWYHYKDYDDIIDEPEIFEGETKCLWISTLNKIVGKANRENNVQANRLSMNAVIFEHLVKGTEYQDIDDPTKFGHYQIDINGFLTNEEILVQNNDTIIGIINIDYSNQSPDFN